MGKTPVLLVDGQAIFESAAICEYLEETKAMALHPQVPNVRAQHRGWMEFASATLNAIGDAAFAPALRYFEVFDTIEDFGVFTDTPKIKAWREALKQRPSLRSAVRAGYAELLYDFLLRRNSALSHRMIKGIKAHA